MHNVLRLIVLICCAVAGLHVGPAQAEKRVALVIGNAGYRAVANLPNPKKDARDVAAALRAAAFHEVIEQYDLGVREMQRALAAFEDKATGADWAVVYYAGHGIEVDGRNFLVPVDAELRRTTDVEDETLALDRVLARVAAAGKLQLIILDACRFNPFKQRMAGAGTRLVGERGLARIEPAHPNVIVAYAARDGQVALDGKPGDNSPYARALVKYLAEPGLELGNLFRKVRDDVLAETNGKQRPFEYGSLTGQLLFFKPAPIGPAPAGSSPIPAQPQLSDAERMWVAVKETTSIAKLEAFRRQYGMANAVYDRLAEARVEELRKQQLALAVPPPAPMPASVIEPLSFGDFRGSSETIDARLQATRLWRAVKQEFPDWYAERLKEVAGLVAQNKDQGEISQHLARALVSLRRQNYKHALAADVPQLKSIARTFHDNLALLRKLSSQTCFALISQGEASPVIVSLMQHPTTHAALMQAQLTAVFEAIADGRKKVRSYPEPRRTDYDALKTDLVKRGWSDADLQLFTDAGALARASPEKVCQLVHDWFAAHFEIKDPDMQLRLLVETIKPVIGG